jgi:DNA polymerase I
MQSAKPEKVKPASVKADTVSTSRRSLLQTIINSSETEPIRPEWYPRIPPSALPGILLDVEYDGQKGLAKVKLYNPSSMKIYEWLDNTEHHPYCLTDYSPSELSKLKDVVEHKGFLKLEETSKFILLHDKEQQLVSIVASDPLAIGGRRDSIREKLGREHSWEADIRYTKCYTMDRALTPGLYYRVQKGNLAPVPQKYSTKDAAKIQALFKANSEESTLIKEYLPLFLTPAAYLPRLALDIEVESPFADRIPDPTTAEHPVIAVALNDDTGAGLVCVLRRDIDEEAEAPQLPKGVDCRFFEKERQLVETVFQILWRTPILITFNGDNFDLRYLVNRAKKLGIPARDIPIRLRPGIGSSFEARLKHGVHVDLYRFFNNRSIQIYAFRNRYREFRLEDISQALLGEGKRELPGLISRLPAAVLADYCWQDTNLTMKLTQFDNNLVIGLILLLMRISHQGMHDLTRSAVSNWIRSLLYYAHRQNNYLIPRKEEIEAMKGEAQTAAVIKGRKYLGAVVVEPQAGVHFDVTVVDFASLYPSIMKAYNISYETVRCIHPDCKDNTVPETPHWICTKRKGLTSLIIGVIRDVRVEHFKPRSKDKTLSETQRSWYSVVEQALKVFLNASYGVVGAAHFPLYCAPAAESITALGRYAITETIKQAEQLGVTVLYGDTDSLFLARPTKGQLRKLIDYSEQELRVELDVEKEYRYVALSSRKKNYLGVTKSGYVDIKGLTGKKRNTPLFLQKAFMQMVDILRQVQSPSDFTDAKDRILRLAREHLTRLERREYSVEELAIRMQLTKSPESYVKTTPQHVKAARQLIEAGRDVSAGDIIAFVKTTGGVKPVEQASIQDIDIAKYKDLVQSTFEQVLDALGVEWIETIGIRRLDTFFG